MTRHESEFRGRWRLVETELWAQAALDLVGPAEISFDAEQIGELRMIAIGASVDYRVTQRDDRALVEFTWSGFDEGDPVCGRGLAERDGDRIVGKLFIHGGDESSFIAERLPERDPRALPRPARRKRR